MGVAVGAAYVHRVRLSPWPLLALATGIFIFTCIMLMKEPERVNTLRMFGYGLPSAIVLFLAMSRERDRGWVAPPFILFHGDASYSIYIWHYGVLMLLSLYWPWRGEQAGLAFIALGLLASAVIACASYLLIEKSVAMWTRRLLSSLWDRYRRARERYGDRLIEAVPESLEVRDLNREPDSTSGWRR